MRFLIVDDHLLVAQALGSMLAEFCDLDLVGIATSVKELKPLLQSQSADLLILDLQLPGESWQDAAAHFVEANPAGAIVVLSAWIEGFQLPERWRDAVIAVLDKACAWRDLTGLVSAWLQRQPNGHHLAAVPARQLALLNQREINLMLALGRGSLNREIASELGLTLATVETYRKTIAGKLGVSGKQLMRLAVLMRLQP